MIILAKICCVILFLLTAINVFGEETLLCAGDSSQLVAGDGWDIESEEGDSYTDFKAGRARLRLSAEPNHVLRIRLSVTYTSSMNIYVIPLQERVNLPLIPLSANRQYLHARTDPQAIEVGFVMPAAADAFHFVINSRGHVKVSDFHIADLGPAPEYEVTGSELLPDPSWENVPERTQIPAENSYHTTLNGWMAWNNANVDTHMITPIPSRVRTGKHAVMIVGSWGGMREGFRQRPVALEPDRVYNFSVWAKGYGTFSLYNVNYHSSRAFTVSPDEWRQFNLPVTTDNPGHRGVSLGLYVNGRIFFDDFSLQMVPRSEVSSLRQINPEYMADSLPAKLPQHVPEGEERSREPVVLENRQVRAVLSPMRGGRVIAFADKTLTAGEWLDSTLLAMDFASQPVTIDWDLPFATVMSADGRAVTFSHTVTGGAAAAPFMDGLQLQQTFHLPIDSRLLNVHLRLTNTAAGVRLPEPHIHSQWPASTKSGVVSAYASKFAPGFILQATKGDDGLYQTADRNLLLHQPIAGWMAVGGHTSSLLFGFDNQAVSSVRLEPLNNRLSWHYPRLTLPPGGTWEEQGFLAAAPLDSIAYADRNVAVKAQISMPEGAHKLSLEFAASAFVTNARVVARVVDYESQPIADIGPDPGILEFTPPAGNFITVLEISTPEGEYSIELFNDPPERVQAIGIHGAGQTQYAPSIPVRIIRLPDAGDLTAEIEQGNTVFWCYGLYSHLYPLQQILADRGLDVKLLNNGGGFPEELDELRNCRMVIISNLGAADLSASARATLSQYVRGGGNLLVMGGSRGLGNAKTKESDLGELLPAELHGAFDCRPAPVNANKLTPINTNSFDKLPWEELPRLYWRHLVTPRAGAGILAAVGDLPALLIGDHGRGRVMLYTGTVEGRPGTDEVAAWEWSGWHGFWAAAIAHLLP